MKRKFFATLGMLILVLVSACSPVIGLFLGNGQSSIAHAQITNGDQTGPFINSGTGSASENRDATSTGNSSVTRDASPVYYGPGGNPNDASTAETDPNATTTTSASNSDVAGKDDLTCGVNILCGIVNAYVAYVQFLPHLLAVVSGLLLDWIVWKNLQSETWTSQDSVDSFVVKGWKLTRDFSNLLFIFALFVVAFSLILSGASNQPLFGLDPKRTIARVILMAVLINFSFFMCRVIIDVTNIAGNIFYSKITVIDHGAKNQNQTTGNTETKKGTDMGTTAEFTDNFIGIRSLSTGILAQINPQRLVLRGGNVSGESHAGGLWYSYDMGVYILLFFVSTLVGLFNFFLIYLFISSTIFLAVRIYALYFLIILSPIAFISTTIPQMQSKEYFGFDDWFKQLTGLAFCLPIYLFFVYLAIFFLNVGNATEQVSSTSGYIALATLILAKLIMMGVVLILGKKISKDLSGKFGAMASNVVTGVATGAAMIAGAAMTGGTSAALSMTGTVAKNAAMTTARGVGGAVLGDERAEAWEKRLTNMKGGNGLKRLNNFNLSRNMSGKTVGQRAGQFFKNVSAATGEAARFSGSTTPDAINAALAAGLKAPGDKKVKDLEFKISELTKHLENPNLTKDQKQDIRDKLSAAKREKWNTENPGNALPVRSNTTPPAAPVVPALPITPTTPAAPAAAAVVPTVVPTKPLGLVNQFGQPISSTQTGTSTEPTIPNTPSQTNPTAGPMISPEQIKSLTDTIDQEMREIEKELTNPIIRLDKARTQKLEQQFGELEQEKKNVVGGSVLPTRLNTSIPSVPFSAPTTIPFAPIASSTPNIISTPVPNIPESQLRAVKDDKSIVPAPLRKVGSKISDTTVNLLSHIATGGKSNTIDDITNAA